MTDEHAPGPLSRIAQRPRGDDDSEQALADGATAGGHDHLFVTWCTGTLPDWRRSNNIACAVDQIGNFARAPKAALEGDHTLITVG